MFFLPNSRIENYLYITDRNISMSELENLNRIKGEVYQISKKIEQALRISGNLRENIKNAYDGYLSHPQERGRYVYVLKNNLNRQREFFRIIERGSKRAIKMLRDTREIHFHFLKQQVKLTKEEKVLFKELDNSIKCIVDSMIFSNKMMDSLWENRVKIVNSWGGGFLGNAPLQFTQKDFEAYQKKEKEIEEEIITRFRGEWFKLSNSFKLIAQASKKFNPRMSSTYDIMMDAGDVGMDLGFIAGLADACIGFSNNMQPMGFTDGWQEVALFTGVGAVVGMAAAILWMTAESIHDKVAS